MSSIKYKCLKKLIDFSAFSLFKGTERNEEVLNSGRRDDGSRQKATVKTVFSKLLLLHIHIVQWILLKVGRNLGIGLGKECKCLQSHKKA